MEIKIKRLNKDAYLPTYANPGDAGMDLRTTEDKTLKPGERYGFKIGFAVEIPNGYVALVWDKSGLANKHGLKTMAGVIDSGYRGEWEIVICNLSDRPYSFVKGDKIAQALIQKVERADVIETETLSETQRGDGKMGSTGR